MKQKISRTIMNALFLSSLLNFAYATAAIDNINANTIEQINIIEQVNVIQNPNEITNTNETIGKHLIMDLWGGKVTEDPKELEQILWQAAHEANSEPKQVAIESFSPHGITGVIVLAESHISIHTWPELEYAAIDIFTCGKKSTPHKALEYLKKVFKPKSVEILEVKRGKIPQKDKETKQTKEFTKNFFGGKKT